MLEPLEPFAVLLVFAGGFLWGFGTACFVIKKRIRRVFEEFAREHGVEL